ncbi:hypothetical protein [Rhizobium sp. L1K21]|uniref:hypothetical protein n=1 Tax=Rhizobium sp. L1K21 TaxID=2954933 RepID=UPI002093DEC3|nr:hypothetical protein [Rhizobium sp. L1K21]MCO6186016.1 hypothetical protein [Rhizobium sp. L1K21]
MKTVGLESVTLSGRPVIISDVDDVVLSFIDPFQRFLEANALRFLPRSFRLTGNIVRASNEEAIDELAVRKMLHDFFEAQADWQLPFDDAPATLELLAKDADVIFLTAMPPGFLNQRRALLDTLGFHYPLVATLEPKGLVAARIMGASPSKSVFIDDMAHNVISVGDHLPDCLLIHMPPDSPVHAMAPKADNGAVIARSWTEAKTHIIGHFGITETPPIQAITNA